MDIVNLWGDVSTNIGFYTKETAIRIPESPGIYAWYIPLWIYYSDMKELVRYVQNITLFDSGQKDKEEGGRESSKGRVKFNWDYVDVTIKKGLLEPNYKDWSERWDKMMVDSENKDVFATALMKASIFSTPIYIGRADNLLARYHQHIDGREESNTFNKRFQEYTSNTSKKLMVSDLLFVSIAFSQADNQHMNDRELSGLLEKFMLNIVQPPFSCR